MMRTIMAAAAVLALAGCSTAQQQIACKIDGELQPIAAGALAVLVPESAPIVAADTGAIHPAVVAYCADLGGTAVVAPVAAPVVAAPVAAPAAAPATN
jgi:uncharacterized lipoprotein